MRVQTAERKEIAVELWILEPSIWDELCGFGVDGGVQVD